MSGGAVRVVLAEDHGLVRAGLKRMVDGFSDVQVVGEAADGREAVERVEALRPDVVVMDVRMPRLNGLEATRRIVQLNSDVGIVVLTMHDTEESLYDFLRAGAKGFLSKRCAPSELHDAIRAVSRGEYSLAGNMSAFLVQAFLASRHNDRGAELDVLTSREREILQNLAEGASNRDVAAALFISVKTVETHRSNLMRKLNLHNTAELVRCAVRHGLTNAENDDMSDGRSTRTN